tara:strand:+ start:2284 stop:2772 length:489 start_codon:yes stop_codon:yes gene_type:complete
MNFFKNLSLKNKQKIDAIKKTNQVTNQYIEIGRLVKEARIQKNISIEELSQLSRIPKYIINSIENNIEKNRPKYPFMRSILLKLEDCLLLRKNILLELLISHEKGNVKEKIIIRKLDFINNWHGSLLYFFILILTIFILKRYFFFNISIIEIQNIEQKIKKD